LVATLLIMALSTVAVGLIPNTAAIGVTAPLMLIALRLLQGFAVGGEWAGSALLSAEYAPATKRGRYGTFTMAGSGAGFILAGLTFLGVNYAIGENSPAFVQWGWRLPFLISTPLIGIGLYVRLNIDETPVFAEENARRLVPKAPLAELLRLQRREITLAAGSILGFMAFGYMISTYLATYAHTNLGYSRNMILFLGVLGGLVNVALIASSATLSDRDGRRRIMLVGCTVCLPWSFAVIPLMDTGKPVLYAVAVLGMHVQNRCAGTASGTTVHSHRARVPERLCQAPRRRPGSASRHGPPRADTAAVAAVSTLRTPADPGPRRIAQQNRGPGSGTRPTQRRERPRCAVVAG
jgi:MFS family permease